MRLWDVHVSVSVCGLNEMCNWWGRKWNKERNKKIKNKIKWSPRPMDCLLLLLLYLDSYAWALARARNKDAPPPKRKKKRKTMSWPSVCPAMRYSAPPSTIRYNQYSFASALCRYEAGITSKETEKKYFGYNYIVEQFWIQEHESLVIIEYTILTCTPQNTVVRTTIFPRLCIPILLSLFFLKLHSSPFLSYQNICNI